MGYMGGYGFKAAVPVHAHFHDAEAVVREHQ